MTSNASSRFGRSRVASVQRLNSNTIHPSQLQLRLTPQQQWQCQNFQDPDIRPSVDAFASFIDDHWSLYDFEHADLPAFGEDILSQAQDVGKALQHQPQDSQQASTNVNSAPMVDWMDYNTLVSQSLSNTIAPVVQESQAGQDVSMYADNASDVESDQSWDEEGGWAAFRAILKKQLQDFAADRNKTSLPINPLPRNQRVIVHTIADTYGFSHRSHGQGKMRSMTIYKSSSWENPFSPVLVEDGGSSTKLNPSYSSPQSGPLRRNSSFSSSLLPRTFSGKTLASLAESSSFDFSLDTSMTNASTAATTFPSSETTSNTSKKRRRNPKIVGGYHCNICDKAFDRECERVKHERYHLEDEQRPHRCEFCPKGYLLLKDLRSHLEKAHDVKTAKFFF
ncbi:hypothetical protein K431DRAFT_286012 [Polychaeton citri CBS 116435]|uniref:C2H2-type domain-containing protein n=1 Tax=Polychaeton citri CBS 116435 TaxID=1314669 RepID=A0A9P4UN00_9PEZI|nr:hypothetical protein K431DRAFT_286012 [Polychaeton citri CBS 116435]